MAIHGWKLAYSGKVRDLYIREGESTLNTAPEMLLLASDRVSAFDHVLEPEIPGKGAALTRLSRWWFDRITGIPNHLLNETPPAAVADRAMIVKTLDMVPIECVVRGYLVGSGFAEYEKFGTVCGIALPAGLKNGDRLPAPIFTPAFKAPLGEHDENISFERTVELVGLGTANALRETSLKIFGQASEIAESRGLILADTKFEFGFDRETGVLTLCDEVLTSDSSRYWDLERYQNGGEKRLDSFDKQFIRDWLNANWDKKGTPPPLPNEVVKKTMVLYEELISRLTK